MAEVIENPTMPVPVPSINTDTKEFWDATVEGRLTIGRCNTCGEPIWYPRPICPFCHSTDTKMEEVSGRGTVYTFTIVRRGGGQYAAVSPYVLAYVELAEGPRMMTNIVDCAPEQVSVGAAVEVVFHKTPEQAALPRFGSSSAMTINKSYASATDAVKDITDGSFLAIAGFGQSHRYPSLMPALLELGVKDLVTVSNSLGGRQFSLGDLVAAHRIKKMLISISTRADEQIASGEIEIELVPQGTLSERLRAGGAGIAGFYIKTGVGTRVGEGKETRVFDGETYILETALHPDFAFIRAWRGDRFGNLQYRGVGRNFNYAFGKGGRIVIAEVDEIVDEIDPELVGLPGIFVDRVVEMRKTEPATFPTSRPGRDADEPQIYNDKPGWTRAQIAEVTASLLPEPSYVNLGLGMPTLVSNFIGERDVLLHAENGVLNYGEYATAEDWNPDIYNAGGAFVRLRPGASFFDSVTSFEMVRGGAVNVVVLGGLQVDEDANLANWATSSRAGGTIGGAMDLAAGGASVIVMMTHLGGHGEDKLVHNCTYPLTGVACVDLVVTDLGVLRRHDDGRFHLERVHPDFTADEVDALTEMDIVID